MTLKLDLTSVHIGIIGLGYVGLPLAVEFGKRFPVIGFDIKQDRVGELNAGHDRTREVDPEELALANQLTCTADPEQLRACNVFIVTVTRRRKSATTRKSSSPWPTRSSCSGAQPASTPWANPGMCSMTSSLCCPRARPTAGYKIGYQLLHLSACTIMKYRIYRSKVMPSLQIRNLPDDLYQTLSFRAEQAHRSLAQQALIELRNVTGSAIIRPRARILETISQDIAELGARTPSAPPEKLIREDRKR